MQIAKLPLGLCDNIDRRVRSFIWDGPNKERIELVVWLNHKWDKVTQPKKRGGLGIQCTMDMNMALMAKLGWRMLNDTNSQWANVLVNKYMGGKREVNNIKNKNRASNA